MKTTTQTKIVVVLAALLLISVVYIAVGKLNESKEKKYNEIYQVGMQDGYAYGIQQLMEGLATCQPIPIFAGEAQISAIAVECLLNDLPKCNAMTLSLGNQSIEIVDTSCLQQQ